MTTEYRKNRKRWGYRVCRAGMTYKKYAWRTKVKSQYS